MLVLLGWKSFCHLHLTAPNIEARVSRVVMAMATLGRGWEVGEEKGLEDDKEQGEEEGEEDGKEQGQEEGEKEDEEEVEKEGEEEAIL